MNNYNKLLNNLETLKLDIFPLFEQFSDMAILAS